MKYNLISQIIKFIPIPKKLVNLKTNLPPKNNLSSHETLRRIDNREDNLSGRREKRKFSSRRRKPRRRCGVRVVGVGASAILCTHVQPPKPVTHLRRAHACTLAYTGRDKACTLDGPRTLNSRLCAHVRPRQTHSRPLRRAHPVLTRCITATVPLFFVYLTISRSFFHSLDRIYRGENINLYLSFEFSFQFLVDVR